jgi:hypothetical protein
MTVSEFLRRRDFGQIAPNEPVRTIIFRFNSPNAHEWEELFIRGRYESIADQELYFRKAMDEGGLTIFISPFTPDQTVTAKNWRQL